MSAAPASADPFDARRALQAPPLLRPFNEAGVLAAAEVHVARRLCALGREPDESVALAAALAVRGPRLGHVHVDLATIAATATVDAEEAVEVAALPWPAPDDWLARVAASPLVGVGDRDDASARPLRLVGTALYLDRYWREERAVAADLVALAGSTPAGIDDGVLASGLARFATGGLDPRQTLACAAAVASRFAVVAGGPGTGKTTTVAALVALLAEQAAASAAPPPLVALAAPTGKAAARLEEAVHEAAAGLDVPDAVRAQLLALRASTLHRLLGWRPDSQSRFRHDRHHRLPHDAVIVDETSMVSLSLMARLVEAVRRDARLVLIGDPGQLASIEAGAVLADIVGPASAGPRLRPAARERLARVTGLDVPGRARAEDAPVADGIVVLDRVHRFGPGIAAVAEAIRRGAPDAVVETLSAAPPGVTWVAHDAATGPGDALVRVRAPAVAAGRELVRAARSGDATRALATLGAFRVLCAHRRGRHGVTTWLDRIESWLAAEIADLGAERRWYAGRPLLVTENDYGLRLYNGDTGVVVSTGDGRLAAAFDRAGSAVEFSPARLEAVETVWAMTIHKSQGSQFDTAVVLLPDAASPVLTRELLYTAITRARRELILVGTEESLRAAVARPVARASGLSWRLWASQHGPAAAGRG